MTFEPAGLDGAWLLDLERHEDERGFFARAWCGSEFASRSLSGTLAQCSLSYNRKARTIRGMHYQAAPSEEAKVVRCIRGAIYDVLLDLRPASPTYTRWIARELTADNRLAFYVPEGVAHGFQTLTDDTEVLYLIDETYDPALARGVRWNDPNFDIHWPEAPGLMSERDRSYPDVATEPRP
ncbi:MAG: dTDP-4-dehydrorhamnose 3,5-epimerase [Vicinamibacterales bacterium]